MALADVEKQEPQGKLAETLHRISRRPRRDLLAVTGVLICLVIFLVSSRTLYAGNYVRVRPSPTTHSLFHQADPITSPNSPTTQQATPPTSATPLSPVTSSPRPQTATWTSPTPSPTTLNPPPAPSPPSIYTSPSTPTASPKPTDSHP